MATKFINFDNRFAVCGSSNLKATKSGHIRNMRVADAELENGTIVKLGDLEAGSLEVYKQAAASQEFKGKVLPTRASNGNYYVKVTAVNGDYLVLQDPLIYEEYTTQMQDPANFYNAKGAVVRTYELHIDDVFELSKEGFTGEIALDDEVSVDATTKKLKKVTASETK